MKKRWARDGFLPRYHDADWSQCVYKDDIARWCAAESKSLAFTGAVGIGKTMALGLMMNCMASITRFDFAYAFAPVLFSFLHRYDERRPEDAERYRQLSESSVLFIDDLGRQFDSDWGLSRFDILIENRHGNRRWNVITTNLTQDVLRARPGWERIFDRIRGDVADWIEIGGESKR